MLVHPSGVEQFDRSVRLSREPGGVSRGIEQLRRIERQACRALVGGGRDRVGAPLACTRARLLECGRRRFVGPDGREREMPRTAVCVVVRQRARERAVRCTPLLGRSRTVHRRTRESVTELDASVA